MKSHYVDGLSPNEVVTTQFLVLHKEIRQKRTGESYLTLLLADKTGEIEAKMWDNVAEVMDTFDRDDFVKVKGLMQVYHKRSQFTIHKLRRLADQEVEFADFFPCSSRDPDQMWSELQATIRGLQNEYLRGLLEAIFRDETIAAKYRLAPAAKNIHHACRGGLLEHVLSLCALARAVAPLYRDIDLDLLLTGAILHDIGKIEELSYARSFNYSSEGQLLGHIVIGLRIVAEKLADVPGFPSKLRNLLEHIIISHHGELEFGSPKVPAFSEALLLHHLDNLDSKMEALRSALARETHVDSEFTGWVPSLERVLLRKQRYVDGPAAAKTVVPEPPLTQAPEAAHSTPGETLPVELVPVQQELPEIPHPAPGPPRDVRTAPAHVQQQPQKPPVNTLFGEKLQAVLADRK